MPFRGGRAPAGFLQEQPFVGFCGRPEDEGGDKQPKGEERDEFDAEQDKDDSPGLKTESFPAAAEPVKRARGDADDAINEALFANSSEEEALGVSIARIEPERFAEMCLGLFGKVEFIEVNVAKGNVNGGVVRIERESISQALDALPCLPCGGF